MAAHADNYQIASGATLYAGRAAPAGNALVALMGDSLTDKLYGLSPFYNANAILGGVLADIANSAVQGETVQQMAARVDNLYTDSAPGLAGLPWLGWIDFRGGTNNLRGGGPFDQAMATAYDTLLAKFLTYASKAFVRPVPPLSPGNAAVAQANSYLQAKCAASGGSLVWVDDCVNLVDGSGVQRAQFFDQDGIHFNPAGVWQCALDSQAAMAPAVAGLPSPVSTSATDKYPTTHQLVLNHLNAGTGGSAGNLSGVAPDSWNWWGYGAGITGTTSIVAADPGDSNQTPWMRLILDTVDSNNTAVWLDGAMANLSIGASDPERFETVMQMRFVNFDSTHISGLTSYVQASPGGAKLSRDLLCRFGGSGVLNKTLTLRQPMPKPNSNTGTGATLHNELTITGAGTAVGTIDFRCATVRGLP